jgi:hypothetical protein
VEELLSTMTSTIASGSSSNSADLTTSILQGVYGSKSGLNVFG